MAVVTPASFQLDAVLMLCQLRPPLCNCLIFLRKYSLLTCRTPHRIGLPILYHTLLIKTPTKAALVQRTLLERPALVRHVRHLYSRVTTLSLLLVLRAIGYGKGSLQTLDFSIDAPRMSGRPDGSDEDEPLTAVPVRNLAVRHGNAMFLRHSVLEVTTNALAEAIERWPNLVTSTISFESIILRPILTSVTFMSKTKTKLSGGRGDRTPHTAHIPASWAAASHRPCAVPRALVARPCPRCGTHVTWTASLVAQKIVPRGLWRRRSIPS
jgi:hypothetical protein